MREIGKAVGLHSSSTVHAHLANLEKIGLLRRDPTKPRAIELLVDKAKKAMQPAGLPLVGQVAAGEPILAEENIEDYLEVPDVIGGETGDYILRVKGDSMIGAGILEDDFVVVRQTEVADDGEIVVAMIDGRGDGEELLPREGQGPARAGEQGLQADPHRRSRSCSAGWSESSGASDDERGRDTQPLGLSSPIRPRRCARQRGCSSRSSPTVGLARGALLAVWEDLTHQGRPGAPSAAGRAAGRAVLQSCGSELTRAAQISAQRATLPLGPARRRPTT